MRCSSLSTVLLSIVCVGGLHAQEEKKSRDPWDTLKSISLNGDDSVLLSLGGHARARLENHDSFNFGSPAGAQTSDTFLLTRFVANADLRVGEHLRVFAEFKTAQSTSRDLPGGRRTLDVDSAALQQAFVDIDVPVFAGGPQLTLRGGRQPLSFGRERLVSTLPWANTMRAWDGISGILNAGDTKVTAFVTQFAPVQKYSFNDVDRSNEFWGAYSTTKFQDGAGEFDAYFLGLQRDRAAFNGTAGKENRWTIGTRLSSGCDWIDYDVEVAGQFGKLGTQGIRAYMFAAELGAVVAALGAGGRAFIGADYASGDSSSGGSVGTFNQLFPLGHKYLGLIDEVGRQNIIDLQLGVSCKPAETMTARVAYHAFWLAKRGDALYNAGGGVVRASGAFGDRRVGDEIDATLRIGLDRHSSVLLGYSHFFAKGAIESTGPSEDWGFFYAQIGYSF